MFDPEPPPADHPLVNHPQVLVTPHLGASTEEAQISVAVEAARLLADFFQRGQIRFAVNMPTLDRAELDELRLYLDLGRRLGMLHAQMDRGTAKSATIRYRGEVAHKNTRLITASFAAGWMEAALEEQVNLVNAEVLAKERGITLVEEKTTDTGDFGTMIQTEVVTDTQDLRRRGDALRQAVPPPGPARPLPPRRPPRRHPARLHPPRRAGPDRLHRHDLRPPQREHRPDERRPRAARRRRHRRRQPRLGPPDAALEEVRKHPDILSISLIKLPPAGAAPPWLAQ